MTILIFLKRELKGEAQAEVVARVVRRAPAAARHTAAPGIVAPATTPVHADRGLGVVARIRRGRLAVIILIVPVLAPLPHVAAHIVEAQLVGRFLGHGMVRSCTPIFIVPRH